MQNYKKDDFTVEFFPVAMAYVPWQKTPCTEENLEKSYYAGTIFPELIKPFKGRRRGR